MKHIITIEAFAISFCLGLLVSQAYHAGDYAAGYSAGYEAPHPKPPEDKVVGNLLCHYAELACPKKSSH